MSLLQGRFAAPAAGFLFRRREEFLFFGTWSWAASFFLGAQKETKEAPGADIRSNSALPHLTCCPPWTPIYGGYLFEVGGALPARKI